MSRKNHKVKRPVDDKTTKQKAILVVQDMGIRQVACGNNNESNAREVESTIKAANLGHEIMGHLFEHFSTGYDGDFRIVPLESEPNAIADNVLYLPVIGVRLSPDDTRTKEEIMDWLSKRDDLKW